jgi:hypothetical protein
MHRRNDDDGRTNQNFECERTDSLSLDPLPRWLMLTKAPPSANESGAASPTQYQVFLQPVRPVRAFFLSIAHLASL